MIDCSAETCAPCDCPDCKAQQQQRWYCKAHGKVHNKPHPDNR